MTNLGLEISGAYRAESLHSVLEVNEIAVYAGESNARR